MEATGSRLVVIAAVGTAVLLHLMLTGILTAFHAVLSRCLIGSIKPTEARRRTSGADCG